MPAIVKLLLGISVVCGITSTILFLSVIDDSVLAKYNGNYSEAFRALKGFLSRNSEALGNKIGGAAVTGITLPNRVGTALAAAAHTFVGSFTGFRRNSVVEMAEVVA